MYGQEEAAKVMVQRFTASPIPRATPDYYIQSLKMCQNDINCNSICDFISSIIHIGVAVTVYSASRKCQTTIVTLTSMTVQSLFLTVQSLLCLAQRFLTLLLSDLPICCILSSMDYKNISL